MGLFQEIEELERKTAEVSGAEVIGKINRLEYSHQLFARNHKHLVDILEGVVEKPEIRDRIFSRKFRWKSDLLFREISFRLHNFVASAKSLVDHSRRVYTKVYENKGKFEEYDKVVKQDLVENGLIQFVHKLREMCQHYQLPRVSAELKVGEKTEMTLFIYNNELLLYDSWKSTAKEFINSHDEKIDLLKVTKEYYDQITSFHDWVKGEFLEMYSEELKEIESIHDEINQKKKDLIVNELEEVFELDKNERLERLKFVLSGCLSGADLRDLYKIEDKPRTWIIKGLNKLQKYFDVPQSLVTKIEKECT
ncbi:hypothetical protein [Fodinibius sediminis]|nr:hypothetical protein [Fodinibius sediminis]